MFTKICRENINLFKIGQHYRTYCMQTKVLFPATQFLQKSILCNSQYFYNVDNDVVQQYNQKLLLRFSCNNCYANAPRSYVTTTLRDLPSRGHTTSRGHISSRGHTSSRGHITSRAHTSSCAHTSSRGHTSSCTAKEKLGRGASFFQTSRCAAEGSNCYIGSAFLF